MKNFAAKYFAFLAIILIVVWLLFQLEGPLPTGPYLSKSDWLQFLGMFLAFGGTVFIGLVTMQQQAEFKTEEKSRIDREKTVEATRRRKKLQPIFGIQPMSVYDTITDESFAPVKQIPALRIKNAGNYPIANVLINDEFGFHILLPGAENQFKPRSPITTGKAKLSICYDDADGTLYCQAFDVSMWGEEPFFTMTHIEPVLKTVDFSNYSEIQ